MHAILLTAKASEDMAYWKNNKRILKRIIVLIENIQQTPYSGIGKPEALKYELAVYYSRRIDETNRLVYRVNEEQCTITIYQMHYHYAN